MKEIFIDLNYITIQNEFATLYLAICLLEKKKEEYSTSINYHKVLLFTTQPTYRSN